MAPRLYGRTKDKLYYPIASLRQNRARLVNVAFFLSPSDAIEKGYRPGATRKRRPKPRKPAQPPKAAIKA